MIYGKGTQGLRYALKESSGEVAYCSLSIAGGTRAEGSLPEGTAHFVEHTVFKGTKNRSAKQINSCLDRLGGELNAYTTKEEIVLHATVLKEDLDKALRLLLDLASSPVFPEEEIRTERGVILDEIISSLDSPSDDIFDRFEKRYFEGSSLSRLVLGTQESVCGIKREDLTAYTTRQFVPGRMVLSIVAPQEEERLQEKVLALEQSYFAHSQVRVEASSPEEIKANVFESRIDKGLHEANAIVAALAPSLYDEGERFSAILLSNILGGPASNSLLGNRLREQKGWVYGIECFYNQYRECGLMGISFGCDRTNLERCLKESSRIVREVCSQHLGPRVLASYKRQLLGQLAISSDSGEARCLSMGKSMLAFDEILSSERTRELICEIDSERLRSCAEKIFQSGKASTLLYL